MKSKIARAARWEALHLSVRDFAQLVADLTRDRSATMTAQSAGDIRSVSVPRAVECVWKTNGHQRL